MRVVPCDQCNAAMINNVYCHETGCPNSNKEPVVKDHDYYANIVSDQGKFQECAAYVPYYWDIGMDGCADRDDGEVMGFDVTAEDKVMFPELEGRHTVKLFESEQGFIYELYRSELWKST